MLELDGKLTLDKAAIQATNLTDRFSEDDLDKIGTWVSEGYKRDKLSRSKWEFRTAAAMDLAMQIQKAKAFPWQNCSNVAFPLVTIATMQFHARAYPAIVNGTDIVRCRVIGEDKDGSKKQRADRISTHMSYQVLEEDRSWEEQHDRLLINLPIVGCAFKKSYYSSAIAGNTSELVLAQDLVLDYYSKSVETAGRKTHIISLYRNEVYERCKRGMFRDILDEDWYKTPSTPTQTPTTAEQANRAGVNPPIAVDELTPLVTLEQHVGLDLDKDGYAEPYIVTIDEKSTKVLRIVTRFDREEDIERDKDKNIIRIRAMEYFTKYSFIPSPDGGIYDMGFGVLLGPLNESTNSLINQLIDAGTMSNTAGGFLGRGMKVRGGVYTFAPLEWKRIDSSLEDISKGIFPLPVREPSAVLFNLLSLLVNYTNRISGATDMMVGENPGQNTPAETARAMVEQGQKIYSAIFKRVWRGMKEEFKKLYVLNGIYLPPSMAFGPKGFKALREDYLGDPNEVVPSADPNVTSDAMAFQQARAVKEAAMQTPGYNMDAVERRYLKALKVDAPDEIFIGSENTPPPINPKVKVEEIRLQAKKMGFQMQQAQFAAKLMEDQRVNNAKILEMEAKVLKMMADAKGDVEDRQINALNTAIGAMKQHNEAILRQVELIMQGMENDRAAAAESGGMGGVEDAPSDQSGNGAITPMGVGVAETMV